MRDDTAPEVWADHDYTPRPRTYEKCADCGEVKCFTHQCGPQISIADLRERLDAAEASLIRMVDESREGMLNNTFGPYEHGRRKGKLDGIRLAQSYLLEAIVKAGGQ